jgi:hypothetical protein
MDKLRVAAMVVACLALPGQVLGGFYAVQDKTPLYHENTQIVLVRDGERTVLTLTADVKSTAQTFAFVIPVPTVLEPEQINIGAATLLERIQAYTAPRLLEYFDENPCQPYLDDSARRTSSEAPAPQSSRGYGLGAVVEAEYAEGDYDIVILSAEQSQALAAWLENAGYFLPDSAHPLINSYIARDLKFLVVKIKLPEASETSFRYLRPLQIAYETPEVILPLRLGALNSADTQELLIYAINRKGRVESANYPNLNPPAGMDLPLFVKAEFSAFYRALFTHQAEKQTHAVFTEYAGDLTTCNPCAAEPLSEDELRSLGVFWLEQHASGWRDTPDAFVTRLHVRYNAANLSEDLHLQETTDRNSLQLSYILRHPWIGAEQCAAAQEYRVNLGKRQDKEAQALAQLTAWEPEQIQAKITPHTSAEEVVAPATDGRWWDNLWR